MSKNSNRLDYVNELTQLWTRGLAKNFIRTQKLEEKEQDLKRAVGRVYDCQQQLKWTKEQVAKIKDEIEFEKQVLAEKDHWFK